MSSAKSLYNVMIGPYFCILFICMPGWLKDITGIWTKAPTEARNEICVWEKKKQNEKNLIRDFFADLDSFPVGSAFFFLPHWKTPMNWFVELFHADECRSLRKLTLPCYDNFLLFSFHSCAWKLSFECYSQCYFHSNTISK